MEASSEEATHVCRPLGASHPEQVRWDELQRYSVLTDPPLLSPHVRPEQSLFRARSPWRDATPTTSQRAAQAEAPFPLPLRMLAAVGFIFLSPFYALHLLRGAK